jgi:prepilin peptidase CpaA
MPMTILVLVPFVALLLLAAGWDLASYTIPNFISVAALVAFALFAASAGFSFAALGGHMLGGVLGLVCAFLLFAPGYIGGGDAKLFACIALWFGMHDLAQYVLIASLFGGALTLVLMAARQYPLPAVLAAQPWITRLHEPRAGIPYGVALAAGAVAILPYTDIFRSVSA